MNKEELRTSTLKRRDALSPELRARKSAAICEKLIWEFDLPDPAQCSPRPDAPVVAVYAAMGSEVSLGPFIEECYACCLQLAFPCMTKEVAEDGSKHFTMTFRLVKHDDWRDAPFVAKPLASFTPDDPALADYPEVPAAFLYHMVVPLVAYDNAGARLGYGAGNYDRYLPQLPAGAHVIAVGFEEQRVEKIPAEDHDIPLLTISA